MTSNQTQQPATNAEDRSVTATANAPEVGTVDTAVIGGGQAGLAMGYYLAHQARDFVIFEASDRIGNAWRNRWDSLRLFTQAQYSSLPGFPFPAPDDYYPTNDETADYLEAYATRFDLPVCLNATVDTLTRNGDRYVLRTDSQCVLADHVVVATGAFHHPYIPEFADRLDPVLTQFHSSKYRNPQQLPDGDVLIVGAGNSGAEIAMDVAVTDRRIWLSGRDTGSMPFVILNTQVFMWLFGDVVTVEGNIGRKLKTSFRDHGEPLIRLTSDDLTQAGIERVPRTAGIEDGMPRLEDERVLNVTGIVWATGFCPNYDWIEVPGLSLGEDGYPNHNQGVVETEPGLYFLGLPFQRTLISTFVGGVGADARYIAEHLPATESDDPGFIPL